LKLTIFFLIISFQPLLLQEGLCQNAERQYELGLTLHQQENYFDAVTEFYRSIFLDSAKAVKAKAYYQIGLCEREMQNWEKSFNAFNLALEIADKDSFKQAVNLAIAANHLAAGNFAFADFKLLKVLMVPHSNFIKDEARLLFLISSIMQNRWDRASQQVEYIPFLKNDSTNYKKFVHEIEKAIFLPGAGQFYAGDYRNAANAFLLNSLNITLNAALFANGYYVDGILYLLTFTERYYNGNRYQAAQSVIRREHKHDQKIRKELLAIISNSHVANH